MDKVSIIIPCLNEADYIGFLLFSLSRQTYKGFEVIISDGSSQDKTLAIVESFREYLPSLKIVVSQKRSPAIQRNRGAEKAQFERLLFLDADTILPNDFLEKSLQEIQKRKLDLANPVSVPLTKKIIDQYYYLVTNWGIDIMQNIFPLAYGWTIFSKKDLHQKIGGFDEKLKKIAEDTDYIQRAVKKGGKFGIIKSSSPFVSVRRLDLEGRGGLIKNMLVQGILVGLFGKRKAQKYISREYGNFGVLQKLAEREKTTNKLLKKIPNRQFRRIILDIKKFLKSF
jgi:glycosyltransferase involved in cell wall biosynthesis